MHRALNFNIKANPFAYFFVNKLNEMLCKTTRHWGCWALNSNLTHLISLGIFLFFIFLFFVGDCHGPFYGTTPMKIEFHVYFINVWKVESISIGMTLFDVINVCDTREESDESHNHS